MYGTQNAPETSLVEGESRNRAPKTAVEDESSKALRDSQARERSPSPFGLRDHDIGAWLPGGQIEVTGDREEDNGSVRSLSTAPPPYEY